MQNLTFIKNVLLFLFSVQNKLFGMKSKICLIKGEQSIIHCILITMRGGRRWCLDMLITYLLCVPQIPVVDRMPAVEIILTTYEMKGCLSSGDQKTRAFAL